MRTLLAFLLLTMLAACSAPPGPDCQLARVAILPFQIENGALIVDAHINGAPARLIFDTGAFSSLLSSKAVARLNISAGVSEVARGEGIGGTTRLSLATAKTFDLGNLHGTNFAFFTGTISFGDKNPPDGLLSSDFLSAYDIDIDFAGQRIILYDPQGACHQPVAALAPPLYVVPMVAALPWEGGRSYDARAPAPDAPSSYTPRLSVTIGGTSIVAYLDTGTTTTTVYRTVAERHGVKLDDLFAKAGDIHGVGPNGVKVAQHFFEPMTVGDLTVANLPIEVVNQSPDTDSEMLLGLDFMSRVHVWISNSSKNVILEYPPQRSPDEAAPPPSAP